MEPRRPRHHYEHYGYYPPEPPYRDPYYHHHRPPPPPPRSNYLHYWIVAIALLAILVFLLDPVRVFSGAMVRKQNEDCQEIVEPQAVLSRATLAALLTVPEREPRDRIREIVAEPYCILPSVQIRAGAIAIREAYPLEFDPDLWLVILYEGEEYAGYDFVHR